MAWAAPCFGGWPQPHCCTLLLAGHSALSLIATGRAALRACLQGGGRFDSSIVRIPEELVEAGLIRQYEKLPFQARSRGSRLERSVCVHGGGAACVLSLNAMHACSQPHASWRLLLGPASPSFHHGGRSTTRCCTAAWRWCPPLPATPTTSTRWAARLAGAGLRWRPRQPQAEFASPNAQPSRFLLLHLPGLLLDRRIAHLRGAPHRAPLHAEELQVSGGWGVIQPILLIAAG